MPVQPFAPLTLADINTLGAQELALVWWTARWREP
jgi:hypothetical protein